MRHVTTASISGASSLPAESTAGPAPRGWQIVRLAIVGSALFAGLVVTGTASIIGNFRARTVADTERQLNNMALVLAEQMDQSFGSVSLVQTGLIQRMEKLGISSAAGLQDRMAGYDAHLLLRDTINGLPHVESIALIDPRGNIINFSRGWPVPNVNVADRDYFKTLTADRYATSALSEAARNRTTGTWSIYLARKFSAADGEMIGLVVGAIDRRYLEQFFRNIKLGPGGTISLVRTDGANLAAYPPSSAREGGPPGNTRPNATVAPPGRNADTDAEDRLAAVREVAHYPMQVVIGRTVSAALSEWRSQSAYLAGAAGLVVLIVGGAALLFVQRFRSYSIGARERITNDLNHKATELVLRETERVHKLLNKQKLQLDALVDNMAQGVVMLDADARLLVCNGRYVDMYGMSPDVVKPGCTLQELIRHRLAIGGFTGNADEIVRGIVDKIMQREPSSIVNQLGDGRFISVQTQPMAEGGWVITHRDVTDQHRIERENERTQRFLLTVIEHVPSSVIVKNARDLKYVLINQAGEKFYGLPRSKIIGRTANDLFPKSSADAIAAQDKVLLQSGGELSIGTQMIETPANGFRQVMARRLVILDGSGAPQLLLSVLDDPMKS